MIMTVEDLIEKLENPSVLTVEFEGYTINKTETGFDVCNGDSIIDDAATTQEVLDIIFTNAIS